MEKILFFDGVCVMCNSLIDFALTHDVEKRFKFAPLQGTTAKLRIPKLAAQNTTVVLLDEAGVHTESDAIIRLLVGLGGFFRMAALLRIVPKFMRDAVYRYIAAHRYRWFGQKEYCRMLSKEEKARVLE